MLTGEAAACRLQRAEIEKPDPQILNNFNSRSCLPSPRGIRRRDYDPDGRRSSGAVGGLIY
jgi:hypothetical protein